jgi:CHAD domain-containing protein
MVAAAPKEEAMLAPGSRRLIEALAQQHASLVRALRALPAGKASDIHAGRVAARRLRSLLRTYRPLLDARRARLARVDLRSHARALGPVREADVRRDLLLELARRDPGFPMADLARLTEALDEACIGSRELLRRHLQEPHWIALAQALEGLDPIAHLVQRRDASEDELLKLAGRPWRRSRRGLEHFPQALERQHVLRLTLKHCRYALEPLADLAPRRGARLARRLRAAQDAIGEHRDCLLAGHWVAANARALGRSGVTRLGELVAARERSLLRRAALRACAVWPDYRKWRRAVRRQLAGRAGGRAD